MFRAVFPAVLCAALGALAAPAAAAPREAPLKEQTAVLHYEVRVTGRRDGQAIDDRIAIRVPAWAQQSLPANPIGSAPAQAAPSAPSLADQEAGFAEANRLLDAVMAACGPNPQSSACTSAQARLKAHEAGAADPAAFAVDDTDQHRYLAFIAAPDAAVEASYDHGGRKGVMRYTAPFGSVALDTIVIDRRTGSAALKITSLVAHDGVTVGELDRLRGLPGVIEINPFVGAATFAPQPTAGAAAEYAGSATLTGGGLRWTVRWRVEWPPRAS